MKTLLLSLGLAIIAAPLAAQSAPAKWEYATLEIVVLGNPVPVWSAGDTTAVLDWPKERDVVGRDTKPRTIAATSSRVRVLNSLGAQGWELVAQEIGGGDVNYIFKRRVS